MAKILITGSKGFIGSKLLAYFLARGYDTVGIDIDIRNKEALRPCFGNTEFVIHAAGKVKKGIPNPEIYYSINVLGTRNVCILCLENDARLIHLGSIATATGDDATVRRYAESKQESQKLVEEYSQLYGLKAVILRLGVIYDRENDTGRRGPRYPIERLAEDIEKVIESHDFSNLKLVDYSNVRA